MLHPGRRKGHRGAGARDQSPQRDAPADGFGNVAVETHLKTALFIPLHGVCRHGDGGLRRSGPGAFFFTQQANGGLTVHLWHLKIDQQNVPHARAPAFQQCDAIIDDLTGVPEPLKQARGDLLVDQIIFRKQDPEPGRVRRDGGAGALSLTVFGARSNAAAIA